MYKKAGEGRSTDKAIIIVQFNYADRKMFNNQCSNKTLSLKTA